MEDVWDNRVAGLLQAFGVSLTLCTEGTNAASCQDTELNYIPGLKLNLPPWQIVCELNMIWTTPAQFRSASPLGTLLIERVSIRQLGETVNITEHMAGLSPWW